MQDAKMSNDERRASNKLRGGEGQAGYRYGDSTMPNGANEAGIELVGCGRGKRRKLNFWSCANFAWQYPERIHVSLVLV